MGNINNYINIFNRYYKRFDIKAVALLRKFHHSYRVMEYSNMLASNLGLDSHDLYIANIIGLFHDIGRFTQYTKYGTYCDDKSIDHAKESCDVLENENMLVDLNCEDYEIVMRAIYNHNKYEISKEVTDKCLLHSKIIRDADKIDIMLEQANIFSSDNQELSQELLNNIYSKNCCIQNSNVSEVDIILVQLGFLFDINYRYTIDFLLKKNWFENKFNLLENYCKDKDEVYRLKNFIMKYVHECNKEGDLC